MNEEHRLERRGAGEGLDAYEAEQLRRFVGVFRQRQARRAAGLDPAGAGLRPESTVEGYLQ